MQLRTRPMPAPYLVPGYKRLNKIAIHPNGVDRSLMEYLRTEESVALVDTVGAGARGYRCGWVWYDKIQRKFACEMFEAFSYQDFEDSRTFFYRKSIRTLCWALQNTFVVGASLDWIDIDMEYKNDF